MSEVDDTNQFSLEKIQHLLNEKIYEQRALSEAEYVAYCHKIWDETICKPNQTKIIFDELQEDSEDSLFPGIKLDYKSAWTGNFQEHPADENEEGDDFAGYTEEQRKTAEEMYRMEDDLFSKETISYEDFKKLSDAFQDAVKKHQYDGIRCLILIQGVAKDGKFVKTSYKEWRAKMDEQTFEESTEVQNYFIALFDILGFSKLIENIGTAGVITKYKQLMQTVLDNHGYRSTTKIRLEDNLYYPSYSYVPIKHTYFSDTIILWAEARPEYFSTFLSRCCDLLGEGITIGLPLRGGISCGDAIMHSASGTFVGEGIVEAAKMEGLQMWIGATLCTSVFLNNLYPEIDEELIVPMFVNHLKPITLDSHFKQKHEVTGSHEKPYLTLDWMARWEKTKDNEDYMDQLDEFKRLAPAKNQIYYENTFDFLYYAEAWGRKQRGDYLRSTFFSLVSDTKDNHLFIADFDQTDIKPAIIVFNNGTYKCGYILGINKKMDIKDSALLKIVKTHFLFMDFIVGGYCDSFYREIKYKMFDELETRIFIERYPYNDIYCVDSYSFDKYTFDAWDDPEKLRRELTEFVKKKKML